MTETPEQQTPGGGQGNQPGQDQDPLQLSKDIATWIGETRGKIAEFRDQIGTPTLAIDAGTLSILTQVDGLLQQGQQDLNTQLPAEEDQAQAQQQEQPPPEQPQQQQFDAAGNPV